MKVSTRDSLPRGARINPTDPLISAGYTNRSPRESVIICFAHVEAALSSRAVSAASAAPAAMRAIDANDGVRIEHGEEALEDLSPNFQHVRAH